MKIDLERVNYMPEELKPGILYVSEEFGIAVHLCPCGCGSKINTPLSPSEWNLEETGSGPTLYPSVGNWQQVCQSHYWITRGDIVWADKWTPEQIATERHREEKRRRAYYGNLDRQHSGVFQNLWRRVKGFFSR